MRRMPQCPHWVKSGRCCAFRTGSDIAHKADVTAPRFWGRRGAPRVTRRVFSVAGRGPRVPHPGHARCPILWDIWLAQLQESPIPCRASVRSLTIRTMRSR
jgi:hypothetical protein